jgi:dynein assembly factor 3
LIARQLLLLHILFDDSLSRDECISRFLDVYGNIEVTEKTFEYVNTTSADLIRLVTDGTGRLSPHLDFTALRFRERDDIEFVLKFWKSDSLFLIAEMWEETLRKQYASRYDSRNNLIDWDYHMNLVDKASIVHVKEFLEWRMDGRAFHNTEATSKPNRTCATVSGLIQVRHMHING